MVEDKCWACLRISPKIVFQEAHKIFKHNPHQIAEETCKTIEKIYRLKPQLLCGKPRRTILGALFYWLSGKFGEPKTQREIAKELGATVPAIRNRYKIFLRSLPEFFSDIHTCQNCLWLDSIEESDDFFRCIHSNTLISKRFVDEPTKCGSWIKR